jgi:predicted CXXCH cytochrome family protein
MKSKHAATIQMFIFLAMILLPASASIENSPHDLTAFGEGDVCGYCHTPHSMVSSSPGWSYNLSDTVYKIYQSSSLDAAVGQPTGSSKLCLSCHDGTVASTHATGSDRGGVYISSSGANLGTDLSDDHPISFVYSNILSAKDTQIRSPSSLPEELKLDRSKELQCTTCHDPHDNINGHFLVMSNEGSAMCLSCHDIDGWQGSIHEGSSALVQASSDEYLKMSKYATVSENGCGSCHRPHSAGGRERLLHFAKSEENCLNCHNGSVASTDIRAALSRQSRHDVSRYNGVHDPEENPASAPKHVECEDCHNPHSTQNTVELSPIVPGVMSGVSGITASGGFIKKAQYEYEVCYKCHDKNYDQMTPSITRKITQANVRLEFDTSNPSFHPVVGPGVNRNVPSLKAPHTVTSTIYCIDCHNSDSGSRAKGPHGSLYEPILAYNYETKDFTQESAFAYELCYNCHSRNSILNNESFPKHREHLEDEIPCSVCHDAHGISVAQGTEENNSHLINFDTLIVSPDANGVLEFQDGMDTFSGQCNLNCHNKEHSPLSY